MKSIHLPPYPLTSLLTQIFLLVADFFIMLFAEREKHIFWVIGGVYFFQFVFIMLNTVILLIRFTHTYAFKAGKTRIMIREFMNPLASAGVYMILLVILRIIGSVILMPCNEDGSGCDVWSNNYIVAYVFARIGGVAYYVTFRHATLSLCDPKYYGESEWILEKVRNKT